MDPDLNTDRLDAILRGVNRSLVGTSLTPPAVVQPGQVWRARWDDVLSLVFIDAIDDGARNLVRVAPVRFGIDEADDSAVILPETTNPLSVALSVWPDLVTEIAEVVLERWVTGLTDFDSLAAIEEAAASGVLRRGLPILNETSPRYRDRMLLDLSMKLLSLAATLPSGNGKLGDLLVGILSGATATTQIASVLGVQPRVALQILRGEVFISRSQAEKLATAFDQDVNQLLEANPAIPDDLLANLTLLKRSAAIRQLASRDESNESAAFDMVARGSFALAARGEAKDARDWAGRVDRYLATALSA